LWLAKQAVSRFGDGIPSVHDYELRLAQGCIIEHPVEHLGVAAALNVAPAATVEYVNMHGKAQSPRLATGVSKQKILKQFVVGWRRLAAFHPTLADPSRVRFARLVKVELTQVRDLELHRDRRVALLPLEGRRHHF